MAAQSETFGEPRGQDFLLDETKGLEITASSP
jgi:hypothetical protein